MLVSGSRKPLVVLKKIVLGTQILEIVNKDILIPDSPVFSSFTIDLGESLVNLNNILSLPKIFMIKFSYLKQIHRTKALKVGHKYHDLFYKVVLSSGICNRASICWLQHQPQGWVIILGPDMGEKLKLAITSAIECLEELA